MAEEVDVNLIALVLQLLGSVAVAVGVFLLAPWAGVVTLGVALLAFGVALELRGSS